jgi:hypothetical protein
MHPGPILLGALIGIGGGVVASIPLLALGVADTTTVGGQIVLITIGFGAQFLAGAAAAILSGGSGALDGGFAALVSFAAVAAISLASADEPSFLAIVSGSVIALVLGTAGGVLAESRSA